MKFRDYVNETTKFTKAMQYLQGIRDYGEGLAIFTSMNPNAQEMSKKDNKKLYNDMLSLLKSRGNKYIKQLGKYGINEKSVIVIDMSLRETLDIAKSPIWKQESVIWFSPKDDNGKIRSAMIGNGVIIKSKSIDSGKAIQELDDFYSVIGNRKYSISFESKVQTKYINIINEKYKDRVKSSVPGKGTIELYVNPVPRDKKALGDIIRFTAHYGRKIVYAWRYDEAHHVDISRAVGIKHKYNDPNMLMGAASWSGGKWVFSSSDFLQDFRRMKSEPFMEELLEKDWSWVDEYIEVTQIIDKLKATM